MAGPKSLSEQELTTVREELSTGKAVTVWFTSAAVGVPVGGSAKVISLGDVPEGEFIQVKPAGSRDTMFCSPSELTTARPPRKRPAKPPELAPEQTAPAVRAPAPEPAPQVRTPVPPSPPERSQVVHAEPAKVSDDRPRPASGRSVKRPPDVTVTMIATTEGEWTVEVMIGKKRTVRPTAVSPADVAKAARSLPPEVAEAIESTLEAARQRQLDRVEALRAELDAAQRALEELTG
ncbi:DUF6319 family protein [Pseudonocardia spinosispora]|uniref:DUF6319 family protein n=1 Tax=Pseudonocardia spinosispora TaxID=103441 RepID=UPI0003F74F19|nr:DUF6319 family protein [Pseudonocardia spinosispora]